VAQARHAVLAAPQAWPGAVARSPEDAAWHVVGLPDELQALDVLLAGKALG